MPDDGERFAIVGWKQGPDLLGIQEFADSDYAGADELPWRGAQARKWRGALWMPHSGLAKDGGRPKAIADYYRAEREAGGSRSEVKPVGDRREYGPPGSGRPGRESAA